MPSDDQKHTLGPEVAAYLRAQRKKANLTQAKLATYGEKIGMRFDESWVSKWERLGPKQGFLKAIAYLKLIDADLEILQDLLRARIRFPEQPPLSAEDALENSRELFKAGDSEGALGVVLAALRCVDSSTLEQCQLYLAASIAARRCDLFSFSRFFVENAREHAEQLSDQRELVCKVFIESANVATSQGDYEEAKGFLSQISGAVLEKPALRAMVTQSRAFIARSEGTDDDGTLEQFEQCLAMYPASSSEITPTATLLTQAALRSARRGDKTGSVKLMTQAAKLAGDNPIMQMRVNFLSGQAYATLGRYGDAMKALRTAEQLAERLNKPLRLFKIRLEMLELARESNDAALASMLCRRLRADRKSVQLPTDLEQRYLASTDLGRPIRRAPRSGYPELS